MEYSRYQLEAIIDEWILHERNRQIAKRKLCDGVTFEKLAEEFDLSTQQTKNIVYKCQDIIFRHL